MPTVNELLVDEAIRHQVQLAKYSNEVVRKMIAVLNRSDARLFEQLLIVLDRVAPSEFQVTRLESLLGSIAAMNSQAYAQLGNEVSVELQAFTQYEVSYQQHVLLETTPAQIHVASVVPEQVYASAMARPFQGWLLSDVLRDLEQGRAKKIRTTIAQGYTENKPIDKIVRELRGTKANQYADGLLEVNRREAAAIVRTAVSHTAAVAHDAVYDANADLMKALQWSATLDLRTSEICRIRDGKLWTPKEHKPVGHDLPWLGGPGRAHWQCRSASIPVLKSIEELLGLPDTGVTLRSGQRASMDGQVPADVDYATWLKKQSATRQDEVLGPTRGKLMRQGKLPLERMYGLKGQFLTLDQLRASDAAAFRRAGL